MVVTNSCCCFGLRTGAMIIGWFGLISGVIGMLSCIQGISSTHDISEMLKETFENISTNENLLIDLNEYDLKAFFYRVLGATLVSIIMYVALLWGVHKNNHLMLIPWLLMNALYLGVIFLIIFISTITLFLDNEPAYGIKILCLGSLSSILPIYFWVCIYSLYKRFRLEENQGDTSRLCNEEVNFGLSAPMIDDKPPPYNICNV